MTYRFEGPASERRALTWMQEKLLDVSSHKSEGQADEIDDLGYEIKKRLAELENGGVNRHDEWYADLWPRFVFCIDGVRLGEELPTFQPTYYWGEWEYDRQRTVEYGYSPAHLYAAVPKGGGSSKHFYREVPPPIEWDLSKVVQKGLSYYIGKARVAEVDAVCTVPQLPQEIDSVETALRVLDNARGKLEWQRRLDANRVGSISEFIKSPENIIANSAILYAPGSASVSMEGDRRVRIDLSKFLISKSGKWTDYSGRDDLRPLWLIDGQHRVRGLSQSPAGIDIEVPIILFPPDFPVEGSAKIFAEINTLQTKLTALHTLFLQHRFHIPSPSSARDFRPWKENPGSSVESRANHLSYECAAFLSSHEGGPLRGLIKFLDQEPGHEHISQAHQWVDFTRKWFLKGGPTPCPYPYTCKETQEVINEEVENYFRAFIDTCNHGEWRDYRNRWSPNARDKGLLQGQGPSQSLLRLYPTAWYLARKNTERSPIPEQVFREVLRPLKWVDWTNGELLKMYRASGERPRTALRIWMENALHHGRVYSRSEVMSASIRSKAGKGILARPAKPRIRVVSATRWPTASRPVRLSSERPLNTHPTSKWTVFDSRGDEWKVGSPSVPVDRGQAEYELPLVAFMEKGNHVSVRVDWSNAAGSSHAEIRLPRR